jgi:hypothetical protein
MCNICNIDHGTRCVVSTNIDLLGDGTMFHTIKIQASSMNEVLCPNTNCGSVYNNTFFVSYSDDGYQVYCQCCNPNPRLPRKSSF